MLLWSAFLIGLTGSLHCVGMCGPIVLAVPNQGKSHYSRFTRLLLYHGGRIFSYALLGLLVGSLGWGVRLANAQGSLAIITGILIISIAILQLDFSRKLENNSLMSRWQFSVRQQFARLFKRHDLSATLGMGMVNGLLPCGLVYLAIITAINANAPWQGALYMLLFGLGTVPLLIAVSIGGHGLSLKLGTYRRPLQRIFLVLVGGFFLWRGLNFYLPPDFHFWQAINFAPMCH